LNIPIPPSPIVKALLSQTKQSWLNGSQSIHLPGGEKHFPLWAAEFWNKIHIIMPVWESWSQALTWLEQKEMMPFVAEIYSVLLALSTISWFGYIPC
jgi:hypothetical protein